MVNWCLSIAQILDACFGLTHVLIMFKKCAQTPPPPLFTIYNGTTFIFICILFAITFKTKIPIIGALWDLSKN